MRTLFDPHHWKELTDLASSLRLLLMPFLSLVATIALILLMSIRPESYAHSLANKERTLQETAAPRLIIIGGSGSSSSIDARRVAERYGLTPVSMGHYAGLGIRYVVNQVVDNIRSGDVILLAPEYEMLQQRATGDGFLLLEMLHANPTELPEVITPRGMVVMARAFPGWLRVQVNRIGDRVLEQHGLKTPTELEQLYTLTNVLPHGELDISSVSSSVHLTDEEIIPQGDGFVLPHINPRVLPYIAHLQERTNRVGARLYVVMPVMPTAIASMNRTNAETQYAELISLLGDHNVLGTPSTFVYQSEWFLDSLGHLTSQGKEARTEGIIRLLDEVMR